MTCIPKTTGNNLLPDRMWSKKLEHQERANKLLHIVWCLSNEVCHHQRMLHFHNQNKKVVGVKDFIIFTCKCADEDHLKANK